MIARITAAYVRHYADNGQTVAYVEWLDGRGQAGRTEGPEHHVHIAALLHRAKRTGVPVTRETWGMPLAALRAKVRDQLAADPHCYD
jgi:hypothetical protein